MITILGELFYIIFNMSIMASLMGVIILLIGKIKKIPRRFAYILWIVPFLRLWFPFGIGSNYSLMSLISKFATKTFVIYSNEYIDFTYSNYSKAIDSFSPMIFKKILLENIFSAAAIIWIVVAIALLITFSIIYIISKRELSDAAHLHDNVYISDKITSPAVYGILNAKIIIPKSFENSDLTFILAHENAHIRNKDNLWRIAAFFTTAVHWFNPFVWLFLKNFLTETELACDERVLSKYGEEEKKRYALSLVDAARQKNVFVSAFGGSKIRVRIDRILSYQKISLLSTICFTALTSIILFVLLTNAL